MIGNSGWTGVGLDGASGYGGQAFVPATGIAFGERHRSCARTEGFERGLEQLIGPNAERGDFATERGHQGDGAVAGADDNVFFRSRQNRLQSLFFRQTTSPDISIRSTLSISSKT